MKYRWIWRISLALAGGIGLHALSAGVEFLSRTHEVPDGSQLDLLVRALGYLFLTVVFGLLAHWASGNMPSLKSGLGKVIDFPPDDALFPFGEQVLGGKSSKPKLKLVDPERK